MLASGYGATVRLWDPAHLQRIGDPLPAAGRVSEVAFSPDGQLLVAATPEPATADGELTVRPWQPIWQLGDACESAAPYVSKEQVQFFMPTDRQPASAANSP